jgi:hypothetical protein
VPHWKPPPQLVHAILPATGVGTGVGVGRAVGPLRVHVLMARADAMMTAIVRGVTKRVYPAAQPEPRSGQFDKMHSRCTEQSTMLVVSLRFRAVAEPQEVEDPEEAVIDLDRTL